MVRNLGTTCLVGEPVRNVVEIGGMDIVGLNRVFHEFPDKTQFKSTVEPDKDNHLDVVQVDPLSSICKYVKVLSVWRSPVYW